MGGKGYSCDFGKNTLKILKMAIINLIFEITSMATYVPQFLDLKCVIHSGILIFFYETVAGTNRKQLVYASIIL